MNRTRPREVISRRSAGNQLRTVLLKDVAQKAGVDPSTASRVLSGDDRKRVNPETRERILEVARELGYRVNSVARSLRTRRTEAIGLVISDTANPGFAEVFKGVQAAATEAGWHVIVVEGQPAVKQELAWDRLIREGRVDGILALIGSIRDPVIQRVAKSGFPIVLVNRSSEGVAGSVTMEDAQGAETAVDHLVDLGHRRIAHITSPLDVDTGQRRLNGFRAAMRKHHLSVRREWIAEADHSEAGGAAAARMILRKSGSTQPTAAYVASMVAGLGAIQVFRDEGLRVPEDISIIVTDEIQLAAYTAPPLTTIKMPMRRMGEVAAQMLLDAVHGKAVSDVIVPDMPRLVLRGSTAAPPSRSGSYIDMIEEPSPLPTPRKRRRKSAPVSVGGK